jgi:hypothetical protein
MDKTSMCSKKWRASTMVHFMFCWPCISIYLYPANRQSTKKHNTYHLLYTYSIIPDDGLQICPQHAEVDWQNKLRINSASSWFLLQRYYGTVSELSSYTFFHVINISFQVSWRGPFKLFCSKDWNQKNVTVSTLSIFSALQKINAILSPVL